MISMEMIPCEIHGTLLRILQEQQVTLSSSRPDKFFELALDALPENIFLIQMSPGLLTLLK